VANIYNCIHKSHFGNHPFAKTNQKNIQESADYKA